MDTHTAFMQTLRCALQNIPLPGVEQSLWQPVLEMAEKQQVYGLISEKMAEMPAFCASDRFEHALQRNVHRAAGQDRRDAAFFVLYRMMLEKGLRPLVMKGMLCRRAYGPLGHLRPSGDTDVLIQPDEFFAACRVLQENGYTTQDNFSSLDPQTVHHAVFQKAGGYTVEMHVHPIGVDNAFFRRMDECFDHVFQRAAALEIHGQRLYTLCPTDHYLLLVFHAAKHFCGRGFGIRLVTDMAMFYRFHEQEIALPVVEQAVADCGLEGFYSDLVRVANKNLGFSIPETGKYVCPDILLDHMLESGIFGRRDVDHSLAAHVTVNGIRYEGGAGKAVWHALFPSRETLLMSHPEWKEKPLKLIFHYPRRWVKAAGLFFRHRNVSPLRSLHTGRKQLQLLRQYGIR